MLRHRAAVTPAVVALLLVAVLAVVAMAYGEPQPVVVSAVAEPPAAVHDEAPRLGLPTTSTTAAPTTTTTSTTAPPPPTTTTTTTAPPPVEHVDAAPASGDDCGGWRATIAEHFPAEQVGKACAVSGCETAGTYSATIHNPSSTASGLFQFLDSTWRSTTNTDPPAAAYSGDTQIAAAAKLWRSSGWAPWSCA